MGREMGHGELQQHHYRAVREDPQYRLAGVLEVEREELLAMIPRPADLSEIEDRLNALEAMVAERGPRSDSPRPKPRPQGVKL